jgi:hypothetical protein
MSTPGAAIIDSQSVKITQQRGSRVRRRRADQRAQASPAVDEANIQDYRVGKLLLASLKGAFPRLQLIRADSSYKREGFCVWVKAELGWDVSIVEHLWSGLRGAWVPQGVKVEWEKIRPSGFHVPFLVLFVGAHRKVSVLLLCWLNGRRAETACLQ